MNEVRQVPRPKMRVLSLPGSVDHKLQPCRLWQADGSEPRPLLVVLHTWGGTYDQALSGYTDQGLAYNWHVLSPHFRGPNVQPEACGSPLARQDILDAVDWAKANLAVDVDRIYLTGGSGGGHMTMRMAGLAPQVFAAASAWCGITDLAAWYREHIKEGKADNYAQNIVASIGGVPGSSEAVDQEVRDRSPVFHMHAATKLPLDINHGIHDGKTGSVPFWHSIWAFNQIAEALGEPVVSQQEIDELWHHGRLTHPSPEDVRPDPSYEGRTIYLRRLAGACRLTIFDAGHEGLPAAGCAWMAKHSRKGSVTPEPRRSVAPEETNASSTIAG